MDVVQQGKRLLGGCGVWVYPNATVDVLARLKADRQWQPSMSPAMWSIQPA